MRSVYLPRYKSRPARRIKSTNHLWGVVDGMRGGKTGFTNHARYCFVGSASRDGMTLTSVVLGSPSSADRFTSSRRLLEWGFKHYRIKQLCASTQSAGVLPISGTASQTVGVRYATTAKQPVLDVLGPVARVPSLPSSTTVPVFAGQKLGVVRFVQAGQVLATVDVVAAATVRPRRGDHRRLPVDGYSGPRSRQQEVSMEDVRLALLAIIAVPVVLVLLYLRRPVGRGTSRCSTAWRCSVRAGQGVWA